MTVMIQTNKIINDHVYHFNISDPSLLSFKPVNCRLKPVCCPAHVHSRHEAVTYCRSESLCVVTDIPKLILTPTVFENREEFLLFFVVVFFFIQEFLS